MLFLVEVSTFQEVNHDFWGKLMYANSPLKVRQPSYFSHQTGTSLQLPYKEML